MEEVGCQIPHVSSIYLTSREWLNNNTNNCLQTFSGHSPGVHDMLLNLISRFLRNRLPFNLFNRLIVRRIVYI